MTQAARKIPKRSPAAARFQPDQLAVEVIATGLGPLEDLGDGVELLRLGQVRQVAGVQQEGRGFRQGVDAVHGDLERAGHVLVRVLGEADVAVADLNEREAPCPDSVCCLTEDAG